VVNSTDWPTCVNKPSNGALKWQDNVFTAHAAFAAGSIQAEEQAKLLPTIVSLMMSRTGIRP